MQPRVSVVLPCRNEATFIEAAIQSVLGQSVRSAKLELLVADGMSTDGTTEMIAQLESKHGAVRLVVNGKRITPAGLNSAIAEAAGDVIIRFDAHTEYAPDYVQRCLEVLEETGADNVGGPARTKATTYMQKAVAAAYHSPFSVGGARFHDVNYEGYVDTVTYGCWRRETFEKFGYFDEELVRNQDDEHNLRIIRGGGKIYQSPKIKSWYKPRGSLSALFNQYMQYGYWKVRVIQKHRIPASLRHLVPGTFVLGLVMLAVLSLASLLVALGAGLTLEGWLKAPLRASPAYALAIALGSYAAAVTGASIVTAAKADWKLFPALLAVFPCYHFGYGYGFLRGFWDFIVRRKSGTKTFEKLTR